ncbi:glycosyltransferase family 4 protein [Candidatus Collierbacteria bacterium]|nr:glycosyltransferase family 4 protein [Candidatus Collierbacteria bacterium]
MLIGIDGNEANIKQRVGVNVWAFELLKQFKRKKEKGIGQKEEIKFQIYLSRPPVADLPEETEYWKYRVIGPGRLWTRWRLPLDLYFHKPRPDVFLSLSHYAPKWSPVPRVVCVMDLSFLKYPEAFKPAVLWQLVNWTRESVRSADHVITISEFNKREIMKEYGYPAEKITVVYPGVSEAFKEEGGRKKEEGTSGKYLLFVGTLQPKKNLPRLIKAFEKVKNRFPDVRLMIAGKTWRQFADEKFAKPLLNGEVSQTSQVKYLGYVPEEDMPDLYAGAEALVLPSLYEGFGIPAVEAMSVGTLVVASNTTSMPEVVGDAGILFDPINIKDMAQKIEKVLSMNKIQRQSMIKKGMIKAVRFSWDIAANQMIKLFKLFSGEA